MTSYKRKKIWFMTLMPKMLKKTLGGKSFNDQKMTKTQPNCINIRIYIRIQRYKIYKLA